MGFVKRGSLVGLGNRLLLRRTHPRLSGLSVRCAER